jgi:hypothetical protein
MTAGSAMPTAVLAQTNSLPQMNRQGPLPAPIGHRQPRAQDLPPDVLRDEGMTQTPPEPALSERLDASRNQPDRRVPRTPVDDELRICREC